MSARFRCLIVLSLTKSSKLDHVSARTSTVAYLLIRNIRCYDGKMPLMVIGSDIRRKSIINQIYLTGLRAREGSMENVLHCAFATYAGHSCLYIV